MFGLSGYLGIALAVSLAATGAASWWALHEYGVAAAQASRDRAQIAQVEAQATANALAEQQAIDKAERRKLQVMAARAQHYAQRQQQIAASAVQAATRARAQIAAAVQQEGPQACASQPIPPAILQPLTAGGAP